MHKELVWSVSNAVQKNPEIIKPYIKDLVANLAKKEVSNAIIRNSLRVLQQIDIPETLHATVMNACFKLIEKPAEPAANKAFTLTTLFNITKCYPEIKQELKLIIEDRYNTESPAFKSRAKKILSAL